MSEPRRGELRRGIAWTGIGPSRRRSALTRSLRSATLIRQTEEVRDEDDAAEHDGGGAGGPRALVGGLVPVPAGAALAYPRPTTAIERGLAGEFLALVNLERSARGLPSLAASPDPDDRWGHYRAQYTPRPLQRVVTR